MKRASLITLICLLPVTAMAETQAPSPGSPQARAAAAQPSQPAPTSADMALNSVLLRCGQREFTDQVTIATLQTELASARVAFVGLQAAATKQAADVAVKPAPPAPATPVPPKAP